MPRIKFVYKILSINAETGEERMIDTPFACKEHAEASMNLIENDKLMYCIEKTVHLEGNLTKSEAI